MCWRRSCAKIQSPLATPELEIVATRLIDKLEYQRKLLLAKRHKLLSGRNSDADFTQIERNLPSS